MENLYQHVWGQGEMVLALHPLGLEGGAFEAFGRVLAERGVRTVALDLPGFGRTPYPGEPLTMARLAQPVVAEARRIAAHEGQRPAVLGISLGGRVALECALQAPETFREVIPIAPWLPWLRFRELLRFGRWLDPDMAERVRLEAGWPVLRLLARFLERAPLLRDDSVAQAGARLVYNFSCPASRASFVSAAREMALESAFGPEGLWTRLPNLEVPAAFVWGERDRLVSARFAERVARSLPQARQVMLPCVGHALNGPHHRCLAHAVAALLTARPDEPVAVSCLVDEGSPRLQAARRGSPS